MRNWSDDFENLGFKCVREMRKEKDLVVWKKMMSENDEKCF